MSNDAIIRIAAAVVMNDLGETLLVRKRGTRAFMQPGGKIAPGETPMATLIREIHEELGCVLSDTQANYVGCYAAPAGNEPNKTVEAQLFLVTLNEEPKASAEIEEAIWVCPTDAGQLELAPLTSRFALPIACGQHSSTL